jgi:uncharacterized phage protein (TIGR02218 family)
MKTRSAGLIAHQALASTTRAWCWKVTRADAQVFGFTSVDQDLLISGVTYAAASGFTPTAIDGKADLSVPNLEVVGMLDSAAITEADLLAGKWDAATVEIFEVNYADLTQGTMNLRTGTIGNVSAGRVMFNAELRGLAQKLQQSIGEVFSPSCSATLGDTRCTVSLGAFTAAGTVTTATSARAFTASAMGQATDYFGAGKVTWTGGLNTDLSMEVRDFTSGGIFALSLPMPYAIAVGDTFNAVAGCRKTAITDCKTKFSNLVNFRGHPYVPGNDRVLGNAALSSV